MQSPAVPIAILKWLALIDVEVEDLAPVKLFILAVCVVVVLGLFFVGSGTSVKKGVSRAMRVVFTSECVLLAHLQLFLELRDTERASKAVLSRFSWGNRCFVHE